MIKNKRIALIYRMAAMLAAIAGVLELLSVFDGKFSIGTLYYYTTLSNILVIVLFGMLIARTISGIRKGDKENACYYPRVSMICTIDILLTFGVFWVLLVPYMNGSMKLWTFGNLSVHAITPLLCLLDYILFTEPHRLKYRDIYYVAVFPIFYVIFSSIAGLAGHVYSISSIDGKPVRFPYFFFDFDRIGIVALAYIAGLLVVFFIIGHIFYFIDKKARK